MKRYFTLHLQNFVGALGRAAQHPFGTTLTVLVIAVALALPAGLRVLINNIDALSGTWQSAADFTVADAQAAALAEDLRARAEVTDVTLIKRDEALEEFRTSSGFGAALDALDTNPLPHTLVVRPSSTAVEDIQALAAELNGLKETELVRLDTEWLTRLRAMVMLVNRGIVIASSVLAIAVVVLIGNTIRLEIYGRREEIEVIKLVGGSDGFVRRPFLYLGLWYGLLGGLVAALLVGATLLLLRAPVATLAALYGSDFGLAGLSPGEMCFLLTGGAALGWAGAGLAAARHLRAIEPS
jgi:cell division transport system permease protein